MTGAHRRLVGRTILIVEDLYLVGLDLRSMFEEAGACPIGPVANAREALAIAAERRLDGVVLDVRLRGETSTAVAETLLRQHVPFIVVTACTPDAVPAALRKGVYMAKPVSRAPLIEMASALFA